MIIVKIVLNVYPEKRLEFTQAIISMVEPTGKETGCLSYALLCDIEDSNRFNLLGEWETREDLDNHFRSHRFSVLLGSKSLLCKPLEIKFYTISTAEGMEAINSVRNNEAKSDPVI
jgi:quinol monooxygenase YgiN